MSIRLLKTFLAVARHGTLALAAQEIGLTQAAVSIQIHALEDTLRTQLFDRSRRSAKLNTAGRELVARAHEVVTLYENMALGLKGGQIGGLLTLGASPPTLLWLLPDALLQLQQRYPAVAVRVTTGLSSELTLKVERGELDAALIAQPPFRLPHHLSWESILAEPLVLLTPGKVKVTALRRTLTEFPFIGINKQSWTGRLVQATLRRHHIAVDEVMELDSLETIKGMVARGFGVSILPLHPSQWLEDKRVKIALLTPPTVRAIGLLQRAGNARAQAIVALRACLREQAVTTRTSARKLSLSD